MPIDLILQRIAAADWTDVPEATVCSQLIMPVLMFMGYGQNTLHKVAEQQTYKLEDPTIEKGSRRVRLDYQPRVYEESLWVMEARGPTPPCRQGRSGRSATTRSIRRFERP